MIQIASKEYVYVPRRQIRIEKRENKRVLLVNDVIQDSIVQESAWIDRHPGFESEALHNVNKSAEVYGVSGHSNINIHGDPLDTVENTCYASANNEIDIGIKQRTYNFLVLAHSEVVRLNCVRESSLGAAEDHDTD